MEKSFYHTVDWAHARVIIDQLQDIGVPFVVEQPPRLPTGQIAVVFPDLPVRQYGVVHRLFDCHGHRYPSNHCSPR